MSSEITNYKCSKDIIKNTLHFLPESVPTLFLFYCPNQLTFISFYIITATCTVDLLVPKCFAACLTVALLSIIYRAINNTLSSIYSFKKIPCNTCFYIVCRGFLFIPRHCINRSVTPCLILIF